MSLVTEPNRVTYQVLRSVGEVANESSLQAILRKQKAAFIKDINPSYETRLETLDKLKSALVANKEKLVAAVRDDFGQRPEAELWFEIAMTLMCLDEARKSLRRWMNPVRPGSHWRVGFSKSAVVYQPKGVVGVISSWNYPIYITFAPVIAAISAGNRVMMKPPELSPNTSTVIKNIIGSAFREEELAVIVGDTQVAIDFCALNFDHLIYTGSTSIGRQIMMAAAKNLTPVTLELGGKSPTVIHDSYPVEKAVSRILSVKMLNSGQTCIAPDYLIVSKNNQEEIVAALNAALAKVSENKEVEKELSAIINQRHFERIEALLEDAKAKGATLHRAFEDFALDNSKRVIPPTIVTNVTEDMLIMQEEIFGPVLPVLALDSIDHVPAYLVDKPHPLALYYFDDDKNRCDAFIKSTMSGGMCINGAASHMFNTHMPFGGVGHSGIGSHQGKTGFLEFSHNKSVLYQNFASVDKFLSMPYKPWLTKLLKKVSR